ncbi:MAG: PDZ domain-containing protein, partial [Planctomycetota bacterium]|nr:PDZ domain-containing protein [Planctomycetota bacterium]
ATRALLDKDLGVAVYDLPHGVKMTRKILEPDPARNLERGRFGVVSGGGGDASRRPLGLVLSRGSDTLGGFHYFDGVEGLPAGLPLIGSGGRLLGISYAQAAQNKAVANYSCVQCHLGDVTAHFKVANSAYSALRLQSFLKKGAYERAHGFLRAAHPTWTGTVARPGAFLPGWVIARVLDDLREHGRVQHSYLGVILGQTAGRGEHLGVQIVSVLKDSPAARAGLKAGDRVRALDGERCHDPALLGRALVLKRPGENVRLGIVGKQEVVEVQLGNRSAAKRSLLTTGNLGLQCVELGEDLRGFLKLGADTRGVVVRDVQAGSVAAKAGVQRGDVITEAGGGPVADLEELEAAVAGSEGVVFLKYLRGKETLGVSLKLPTGRNEKAR